MENKEIQKVEFEELCPVCKEKIKFKITKNDRNYNAYIVKGCKHFAEGDFIDQSKYRRITIIIKQLIEDIDLLYARMKKREDLEKLKMLGIDINSI